MSLSKDNAILDVSQKVKPFLQVKLSKFIDSGFFEDLQETDKVLLSAQYGAMIAYENILTIRLSLV